MLDMLSHVLANSEQNVWHVFAHSEENVWHVVAKCFACLRKQLPTEDHQLSSESPWMSKASKKAAMLFEASSHCNSSHLTHLFCNRASLEHQKYERTSMDFLYFVVKLSTFLIRIQNANESINDYFINSQTPPHNGATKLWTKVRGWVFHYSI